MHGFAGWGNKESGKSGVGIGQNVKEDNSAGEPRVVGFPLF